MPATRSEDPARSLARTAARHAPTIALVAALQLAGLLALPLTLALTKHSARWYLPLLLGAALGAVRAPALARLRRRVRPQLFDGVARRALDERGAVPEAEATQAFWGTLIAERVVVNSVPAGIAGSLALATALALASVQLGLTAIVALTATAACTLAAREALRRRRQKLFDAEAAARKHATVWFVAAARDAGELRGVQTRARFLQALGAACERWSGAEDERERALRQQWLLLRVVAVVPAFWIVAGAVGLRPAELVRALAGGAALPHWRGIALLLASVPAVLALGRALDEAGLARRHLHHVRQSAADIDAGAFEPVPASATITASNASVQYNNAVGLANVSFTVGPRGLLAIVGPNGSGKSTLSRLIAGTLAPTTGTLTIDGVPAARVDPDAIALVPQAPLLIESLSVEENARLVVPDASPSELGAMLQALGSRHPPTARLDALSRGERQRVAIARALLKNARITILDEPDAALDAAGRRALLAALRAQSETQLVVLVTHRPELVAACDQVLVLGEDHTLEAQGSPGDVAHRSRTYARLLDPADTPAA